MIAERLKTETKTEHQQLEKAVLPYIKNSTNPAGYAQLLSIFYGYFKPLETLVEPYGKTLLPDYPLRRKAEYLALDLQWAGVDVNTLPLCQNLPVIESAEDAMGALYVMEGSTLGGKIISQMLMKNMQLTTDENVRFFSGYKEQTGPMWHAFLTHLTHTINSTAQQNRTVHAARQVFTCFEDWVKNQ